ncbi:MAG: alkaline phosphatase family protein [Cyclobacteriaceae bacterium]|nr:alkaline phosphatase family protein [Cyclobacteriaceae bacterium]
MRSFLLIHLLIQVTTTFVQAQPNPAPRQPKIVVGITVDQMRQEYLYRFESKFGEGGFKRLMQKGFMLQNAHYNYMPTVTGAGHASIYTGTTPAIHGIIGNGWYERGIDRAVYCAGDDNVSTVGSTSVNPGKMSPNRMLTTSITDELKMATQKRAKVIGISMKDRGAILPAGHMGDAAYWYDGETGRMITSTYYMTKLPEWVERFNAQLLPDKYLNGSWYTVRPISEYTESGPDASPYEGQFANDKKTTFPYNLKELRKTNGNFELLSGTPFSNDYLTEFAVAAIDAEKLGADVWTDFLTLSYSAPDYVGHQFGPQSIEVQDIYLRLDKNIEDLLKKLDATVGPQNYLVFLTADHAVAEVPQLLIDNKVPAGYIRNAQLIAGLNDYLEPFFPGRKMVRIISNDQLFFSKDAFSTDPSKSGIELLMATELATRYLMQQDGIAQVIPWSVIRQGDFNEGSIKGMAIRGYHPKRSGDMTIVMEPAWFESGRIQGTTHGSPYIYDTHVPIIFFGDGVKPGRSVKYHTITDIAPTLSVLLKITFPNGCTGQPVGELFEK